MTVSRQARNLLERFEFEGPGYRGYPEIATYLSGQTGESWDDGRVREEFLLPIIDKSLDGFSISEATDLVCKELKVGPLAVTLKNESRSRKVPASSRDFYGRRRRKNF